MEHTSTVPSEIRLISSRPAPASSKTAASRQALIERGLPIARRIAYRLVRRLPASVDVNDLIGAGHEGLLRAADVYDPSEHPSFEPYAEVRIRGAILDELRSLDRMTRRGRTQLRKLTATKRNLTHELGRPPTEIEMASELQMNLGDYQSVVQRLAGGEALAHGGDIDPDSVASSQEHDPAAVLSEKQLRFEICSAIDSLPQRSRDVLRMYYLGERTQAEIGSAFGVTESRVCQILNDAVSKLRLRLGIPTENRSRRRIRQRACA